MIKQRLIYMLLNSTVHAYRWHIASQGSRLTLLVPLESRFSRYCTFMEVYNIITQLFISQPKLYLTSDHVRNIK